MSLLGIASEGPEFAGRLELMDLGTKHGLRSRGSCRVKGLFSRCRSMNQPELTHWIPGLEKHFPGSRFSPGDSSAAARPCLGVRGSQSQQVGVESGRVVKVWFGEALEFPRFSGIPVAPQRSRFIYPWLYLSLSWGLTQQQKCKQWILGGLDTTTAGLLSLLWVDPLGSTNSQPFPFCQQPLAPGANVSFGFPVPVARLEILPGGALGPGLFSWRIEEEGAAGKCHNCLGSVLTRFVLVTLPAGGQSQYWHNGKIIVNTSSISKFPFRITRFLKSTEEVEAKFGYFWEK